MGAHLPTWPCLRSPRRRDWAEPAGVSPAATAVCTLHKWEEQEARSHRGLYTSQMGGAGGTHFVRLQVPDKMPLYVRRQLRRFIQQLLHIVFAENSVPAVVRRLQTARAVKRRSTTSKWQGLACTSAAGFSLDTATSRTQLPAAAAAESTRATADCGGAHEGLR